MTDVHYASLASRRVQHRVFYLDGHPSRYQPRPTGLNFGEQTGTGVFPFGDSRTTVPPYTDGSKDCIKINLLKTCCTTNVGKETTSAMTILTYDSSYPC